VTALIDALGSVARLEGGRVIAAPRSERELTHVFMVLTERGAAFGAELELDRSSFDRLGPVNDRSMTIEAGAGVLVRDVEAAANHAHLSLGPLPPSAWELRVGELLEHPALAHRAVVPGRLECLAARVTGVTAAGHLVRSPPGPRHAAGPDLASLLVGASRRLGAITSAVLRLMERPSTVQRRLLSFDRHAAGLEALREALSLGADLSRCIVRGRAGRTVIELTLSGSDATVTRDARLVDSCAEHAGGRFEGQGREAEVDGDEHEASWPDVASALSLGASVELHRVSLWSVVARGVAPRVFMPEHPLSTALRAAIDPASLMGASR
jgi:FAD/FMN-containing dehydrogenase